MPILVRYRVNIYVQTMKAKQLLDRLLSPNSVLQEGGGYAALLTTRDH
jgi:hypothetical protein